LENTIQNTHHPPPTHPPTHPPLTPLFFAPLVLFFRQIAAKVSDPTHAAYGNYLSTTQINELTKPKASDIATIKQWLGTATDATVMETNDRTFQVQLPASNAADFLDTTFRPVVNHGTKQASVLASDYHVPDEVHAVANVMGLHGLPLPPRVNGVSGVSGVSGLNDTNDVNGPPPPTSPANVTPAVITSTYGISGVTPQASSGNKQAVAEFQGQTMASSDLSAFFKAYVPNAAPGDDTVSKFVGDPGDKTGETEASLDIQYIMGVAPGIATEFWLWDANDFCGDLKNWTTTLLAAESPPLVTSVSYGWQGNLTGIGCHPADAEAVDADFVKLAAKGITIIFASGDSGSGYAPANQCSSAYQTNTELTGTVQRKNTQ
jgi:tripeptidyl-peptidase-1